MYLTDFFLEFPSNCCELCRKTWEKLIDLQARYMDDVCPIKKKEFRSAPISTYWKVKKLNTKRLTKCIETGRETYIIQVLWIPQVFVCRTGSQQQDSFVDFESYQTFYIKLLDSTFQFDPPKWPVNSYVIIILNL